MEAKDLRYTVKEINKIIEYYLGTPKIYKYCYENSKEFKGFIDNISDSRRKKIKAMHIGYRAAHSSEALAHLGTFGLSFLGKKLADNKEFKKLEVTINSDEFKTLFKNFDAVLVLNGIEWCNE